MGGASCCRGPKARAALSRARSAFRMAECHAVDGLPVVPGDGGGGGDRPRGRKRSAEGSEAVAALPDDASHGQGVTFVHRGSHADGEGVVPPALQEVLFNMCECLSCPLRVEAALDVLARQRKGRPLTLAAFLCAALPCEGDRHISKLHLLAAHLAGMSARTVHNIAVGMRKRGNQPVRPRGAGGRPRREDRPSGRDTPLEDDESMECEDLLADLAPSGVQQVMSLAPQPGGEAEPDTEPDPTEIGLKLGALVARI